MRRAPKVDANHSAIRDVLRKAGASVQSLAECGFGCPDLLVGYRGRNLLMEVKDPANSPSQRKLNDKQRFWHAAWTGQVCVVETSEEALFVLRSSCS